MYSNRKSYLCINNLQKKWFDIKYIKFSGRGSTSDYVAEIAYANLSIYQKGFSCFKDGSAGENPAISIYQCIKFDSNSTTGNIYQRLKLTKRKLDRETKYYLEETQDYLYGKVDFHDMTQGDPAEPMHPKAGIDYTAAHSSRRKMPSFLGHRLKSISTAPRITNHENSNDSICSSTEEEPVSISVKLFMSDSETEQEQSDSDVSSTNSSSNGEIEHSPQYSTKSIAYSSIVPTPSSSHVSIKRPNNSSISVLDMPNLTQAQKNRFNSLLSSSRLPIQNKPTNSGCSSFMLQCLPLKTSLGKMGALALFLGWVGLVASTFGTALFYTAGALAMTGAVALGISLFRTCRTVSTEPKPAPAATFSRFQPPRS